MRLPQLPPLDKAAMSAARQRLDQLTKPPGSLGRLEALAIQLAGMQAKSLPSTSRKALVLMAGDHGVTAEGVSPYPSVVTQQMIHNFLDGGACANVLAKRFGLDLYVADIGVNGDILVPNQPAAKFLNCKVRRGTENLARSHAMSREDAMAAVEAGRSVARTVLETGVDVIALGEMGIGNTTPSTAILCAILEANPHEVTGPGTGLDAAGVARKAQVVQAALARYTPDPQDPLDVLAKVGGLEIGGLAGCIIEAASRRCPVVIDGLITAAAALLAVGLVPGAVDYLVASHCSKDPGHRRILAHLGLQPLLDLEMRLGEGSGAALAMGILDASTAVLREMATFSDAQVSTETKRAAGGRVMTSGGKGRRCMPESGLTLVLGGARSGKSAWAEALARRAETDGSVLYIATAEVRDEEMNERVRRHQARRPESWQTSEAPLHAAAVIEHASPGVGVILVDCLTLFVSNWLLNLQSELQGDALNDAVLARVDELVGAMVRTQAHVIVVSNEVGGGVVPPYPLGRAFRDIAGLANQRVASECTKVYWTVAGIPVDVKALRADR